MSNWELLMAGVKLLVFGMGLVLIFLALMIVCMNLMHKALKPFEHLFATPEAAPARQVGIPQQEPGPRWSPEALPSSLRSGGGAGDHVFLPRRLSL